MSKVLNIILIVFCLIWIIGILYLIKKGRLPIRYSMFWFIPFGILLILVLFPKLIDLLVGLLGIASTNNFIIGIILTMLLSITLILTLIVAVMRRQIALLIQEVSMLKEKK